LRILNTCLPGYGHFNPMVPLARALVEAGHEVAFSSAEQFCSRIEKAGFRAFPSGMSMPDQIASARRRFPDLAALPPGKERFESFVPRMLAGVAAPARLVDLMPIMSTWKPDLLVHEVAEFAGPLAATVVGIPYADHSVGVLRPIKTARLAGRILAPLAREWGVDVGPFGGLFRYLYLDVCPPSLQSAEIGEVVGARPMQNVHKQDTAGEDALPTWAANLSPAPTVYVTLGTVFNQDRRAFTTILEGMMGESLNVIMTVGLDNDPASFGPQPENVHIERYIPLTLLLPYLDLVVTQGGTSILPALGAGLPLLVVPRGADQFHHAAACVRSGAARCLLPHELEAEAVRRELRLLLGETAYRDNARRIQLEIAAMPSPAEGANLLEQLASRPERFVRPEGLAKEPTSRGAALAIQ